MCGELPQEAPQAVSWGNSCPWCKCCSSPLFLSPSPGLSQAEALVPFGAFSSTRRKFCFPEAL